MVLKLRNAILAGPAGAERPLTEAEMIALAKAVELDALDVQEYCRFRRKCYTRNTVVLNEHVELVVICWGANQSSSVHDHGISNCLYLVTEGTMQEELFRLEEGKHVRTRSRLWSRGEITVASGPTIHRISNPSDNDLFTIHIYSPPLANRVTHYTPVPTYEA